MPAISGFSARQIAFHSLPSSKVVSEAPTLEDALRLAELDWSVGIEQATRVNRAGEVEDIPGCFNTVRQDTDQFLGRVKKTWRPFQNAEAFDFADALLGYGVKFDAAGHYLDSRRVFLTAKLPTGITVPGTDDALDLYLLLTTGHDGLSATKALITPVRLACTNMMPLAGREAVSSWSCRHTSKASEKAEEAIRTLNLVDAYRLDFEKIAAQLSQTEVDLTGFGKLVGEIGAPERVQKGMIQTWHTSPSVDGSSGWGAVNAIGEFAEHLRGGRGNPETRFDSNIDGQTAAWRNRATRLLLNR